jgi:deoxyribonuclease I
MQPRHSNASRIVFALFGACLFYGLIFGTMRPPEPHPGLRDDALEEALRKDWSKEHDQLSYLAARSALWGKVDGDGRRAQGVYTGDKITYFKQPLPNKGAVEHAWPLTRLPAEARSDLHHMYAASAEARAARLNLHYGKVAVAVWSRGGSRSGPSSRLKPVFEVREQRRGDVARAMFYAATMYDLDIPAAEEKMLRRWHKQDRVSKAERKRNARVQKRQSSRNPFVDYPKLTERISDF